MVASAEKCRLGSIGTLPFLTKWNEMNWAWLQFLAAKKVCISKTNNSVLRSN